MPSISGIQKTTLVDYPGVIATTVFLNGCNFRCHFCHNSVLAQGKKDEGLIPESELLEYLEGRIGQIDGVCVSGGEPTLHNDLPQFIEKIKGLGLKIKLDTNGTNPEMLKELIDNKLLDYIAMDIKGPAEIYPKIVNTEVDMDKIKESVDLIINSGIKNEFRTTILPDFYNESHIEAIKVMIKGADCYYLQQFRASEGVLNPEYQKASVYTKEQLEKLADGLRKDIKKVKVRGAD